MSIYVYSSVDNYLLEEEKNSLIKQYALAQRKYGVGKGFTVEKAMEEMQQTFLAAIESMDFIDENHNLIDWK